MRIERLFNHLADMVTAGDSTEEDEYGRPIPGSGGSETIECRVDRVQAANSRDESGTDTIWTYNLICGPDVHINSGSRFANVRDKKTGAVIVDGSFAVDSFFPAYNGRRLHHYEVALKKG